MLRRSAVAVLLYFISAGLHAGGPLYVPHGAGQAGMAYACVASPGHWNSFHNQALMAGCSDMTVGFSLESRFMMAEMSSKALTLIIPGNHAPLGLIATHFGYGQYSVIYTGLGSAVTITNGLSLGIQADFINERAVGDYPDVSHLTFEAGLLASITSELTLGLHVFNPLAALNSLPSSLRTGISWSPTSDLILSFETSKVTNEPLSLHGGMSWQLLKKLAFRTGYQSSPSSFAFGAGYSSGPVQTDVGFLINSVTGVTSSVSFTWTILKR